MAPCPGAHPRRKRHMQLGLVGLGKMGFNMRERLREDEHEVIGYDPRPGVTDVPTLAALAEAFNPAPVVWVMVPSDPSPTRPSPNSPRCLARTWSSTAATRGYTEDGPDAKLLGDKGIAFVDAGVSGGVWGLKEGYGLMVGGSDVEGPCDFETLRPPGELTMLSRGPCRRVLRQDHQRHRVRVDDGVCRGL